MKLFKLFSPKKTEKMLLGGTGEKEALKYLKKQGYVLLEKNWRHSHSEIDLIMTDGDCVVFCEVRTQSCERVHYTTPSQSVSQQKKASLSRGASYYLAVYSSTTGIKSEALKCRFDIVEVYLENGRIKEINHIKDAFYHTRSKTKGTRYKSCRH